MTQTLYFSAVHIKSKLQGFLLAQNLINEYLYSMDKRWRASKYYTGYEESLLKMQQKTVCTVQDNEGSPQELHFDLEWNEFKHKRRDIVSKDSFWNSIWDFSSVAGEGLSSASNHGDTRGNGR